MEIHGIELNEPGKTCRRNSGNMISPSGDHQQGMCGIETFFSGAKLGFRRSLLWLGPQAVQSLPCKEFGSHPSSSAFIPHHPSSPTWFFHRAALPSHALCPELPPERSRGLLHPSHSKLAHLSRYRLLLMVSANPSDHITLSPQ